MNGSNGPRGLHDLPSSSKINWTKFKKKNYLHFDKRVDIMKDERMQAKIQDPTWIASYAFLPSIHFKIVHKKYVTLKNETGGKFKKKDKKPREIYYAAHKDSLIYKYYGDLLNDAYNDYSSKNSINNIAVAYRNNKRGKNNIDFAYEVFDFLKKLVKTEMPIIYYGEKDRIYKIAEKQFNDIVSYHENSTPGIFDAQNVVELFANNLGSLEETKEFLIRIAKYEKVKFDANDSMTKEFMGKLNEFHNEVMDLILKNYE